jgi:Sec-independent protein translocase protein TatA
MNHRVVVRDMSPGRWRLLLAAIVVVVLVGLWGLYELGRYQAGYNLIEVRSERHQLRSERDELQKRVRQLREEKVALERAREIEAQAHKEVQSDLKVLQDEILELKEELAFYRGIVSPGDMASGLRIQSFNVRKNPRTDAYRYQVVLTQVLKNDNFTSGTVDMEIEGIRERGGEKTTLSLSDVSVPSEDRIHFRFKYFQEFEGDLELPEGFVPFRVNISVNPSGRRYEPIEETFDWPVGSLIDMGTL